MKLLFDRFMSLFRLLFHFDLYMLSVVWYILHTVPTWNKGFTTILIYKGLFYRGDEEYLYVSGVGIKTGDYFQFYRSDPDAALHSIRSVTLNLKNLKLDQNRKNCSEVFGGLIFSCYGRGGPFFTCENVDSSPFVENFPELPFAGIFCGGEIGRSSSNLLEEAQKKSPVSCSLHVYSSIYLVMSYTP